MIITIYEQGNKDKEKLNCSLEHVVGYVTLSKTSQIPGYHPLTLEKF